MQSHIRKAQCYLAVFSCHLHFWQNDRDLLRANAVTRGLERIPKFDSAQKADPREENSPAAPAGIRTRDLIINHESGAVTTELSPLSVSDTNEI